ncbi:MAG: LemA family protein [Gammaproteobacteria bacterium]|nr:MAG: LemA family protein [Gammaproteobacteria bacterium]
MESLFVILGIGLLLVVWVVMVYNSLIAMIQAIKNNDKQIDVQLDRRGKVFESLVNTVKKAMSHEIEVLTQVTALRAKSVAAGKQGDMAAKMAAENEISSLIPGLSVQMEAYPQITANNNAMQLQEEIVSTENKLSFAKQAYNDSIEKYETKKQSFFETIVVGKFPKLDQKFAYWGISEEVRTKEENRKVEF